MHGNFLGCHARLIQPAGEPHPFGSPVGRRSQVHRDAFNGAPQQQRPLLASRASPKRPTDQSISSINAVTPLVDRTERNQTRFHLGKRNCVHALAHKGRGSFAFDAPSKQNSRRSEVSSKSPPRRKIRCPSGGFFRSTARENARCSTARRCRNSVPGNCAASLQLAPDRRRISPTVLDSAPAAASASGRR